MIEPEVAFADQDDNMVLQENFVSAIVQRVLERRRADLEVLERDIAALERVTPPFPRISYDEAVERIQQAAADGVTVPPEDQPLPTIAWGDDFGSPHETFLAAQFARPVFVVNYPTAVKAFYMQPVDGRPEVVRCADLLAPEGYGEIIGGSQRIHDVDLLERRMREHGLNPEHYQLVSRSAPLRYCSALRLRHGYRALHRLDRRHAPYPRDDPVPTAAVSYLSVIR